MGLISSFVEDLKKRDKSGVITTIKELRENQFGLPLQHYAQQYLFGATGLRLKVFHSISGPPQSCKSPLLFDLMGHIAASKETGGLGGIAFLYELEDKISPTLLASVLRQYGDIMNSSFLTMRNLTIEGAIGHMAAQVIPGYGKEFPKFDVPLVFGMDSIGGAASDDTVKKITTEGSAGKGYYDKPHFIKYFCENAGQLMGDIPMIVICINQEKDQASSTPYGPPQKKITGGVSQLFKDGHMISATYKTWASGDGKTVTLRTTKTSFCDARKIEVKFHWNKFGQDDDDAYNMYFDWALASAKCLADPDKGVGELRDICDVKISDRDLVTCPQLNLKSVPAAEFEAALFDPANAELLNRLYTYQKIEKIKGMDEYVEYIKRRKAEAKDKDTTPNPSMVKTTKAKTVKKSEASSKPIKGAKLGKARKVDNSISLEELMKQAKETNGAGSESEVPAERESDKAGEGGAEVE